MSTQDGKDLFKAIGRIDPSSRADKDGHKSIPSEKVGRSRGFETRDTGGVQDENAPPRNLAGLFTADNRSRNQSPTRLNEDLPEIEIPIDSRLNLGYKSLEATRLLRDIEKKLSRKPEREVLKETSDLNKQTFLDQYAENRQNDEILRRPLDPPFSYTSEKTVMKMRNSAKNLVEALDAFRPMYEKGEGLIKIPELFENRVEAMLKNFVNKNMTEKDHEMLELFRRGYEQVSVRGRMIEGNLIMIRNIVLLSKFFADRLGHLMALRNDQFGPANISIKRQFVSGTKDWKRVVKGENNLIYNENSDEGQKKMQAIISAMGGGGENTGDKQFVKRGKHNWDILNYLRRFEGLDFKRAQEYYFEESSKAEARDNLFDLKKKDKKKDAPKTDFKSVIKPRHKQLLKKFVRVHVLQTEAIKVVRRPSFELSEIKVEPPVAKTINSMNAFNRKTFNLEEDLRKKDALKFKKLNKLEFKPMSLFNAQEDEITQFSDNHWKRVEKDPKKLASKLMPQFAGYSIVSSNIKAKLLINHPAVVYVGKVGMSYNSPSFYSNMFVVLVGFRLYVYSTSDSRSADVVFELEPVNMEKGTDPDPGWYALKNSFQDPMYFMLDNDGAKLLKYLDIVIGYMCVVHMFEQTKQIQYLDARLTNFYADAYEPRFINEIDYDPGEEEVNPKPSGTSLTYDVRDLMQDIIYMSLKPVKYHKQLQEISIINIHLTARSVGFLFESLFYVKPRLKVMRFEYNSITASTINPWITKYFTSDIFYSLQTFSLSGNQVEDATLDNLLQILNKRIATEMLNFTDLGIYPISDIRFSNCGITSKSLTILELYIKNIDKIRQTCQNPELRFYLDLSRNLIDDDGLIEIIKILRVTHVVNSLNLSESYSLTGLGIIKFFGCMDFMPTLEILELGELYITKQMVPFLQRFMSRNPHTHKLKLTFDTEALKLFLSSQKELTKYYTMTVLPGQEFGNKNYPKLKRDPDLEDEDYKLMEDTAIQLKFPRDVVVETQQVEEKKRRYKGDVPPPPPPPPMTLKERRRFEKEAAMKAMELENANQMTKPPPIPLLPPTAPNPPLAS